MTPEIVVTGGGEPSPEELAAVVLALTPVVVPAEEGDDAPGHVLTGWRRAALLEGVGGRPAVSHPDLVGGRSGLGRVGDPTAPA